LRFVLQKIIEQVKNLNISTIDGVKIWFDDNSAILVRPSGTESVYRLYAEAKNQKRAQNLITEYSEKLKNILDAT